MAHSNICCKSVKAVSKKKIQWDMAYEEMKEEGFTVPRYTGRSEIDDHSDMRKEDLSRYIQRYKK